MNYFSPQWTLLAGIILSFFFQGSFIQNYAKKVSGVLLQTSVVLLGAALNFKIVASQGGPSLIITFLSISFVFALGFLGMKLLKIQKTQGLLITSGTAICGGSAMAALSPILKADNLSMAISFGIVFLLNALAVFIFPFIGGLLELSQEQFGMWAALAIHDTSSVVAATSIYGNKALEVGTFIKLIRALWIIPIALGFSFYVKTDTQSRIKIPWFIFGFLLMSLIFTFLNISSETKQMATNLSKLGFAITLFLIGLSFKLKELKTVGFKPLLLGVLLWVLIGLSTLGLITNYT